MDIYHRCLAVEPAILHSFEDFKTKKAAFNTLGPLAALGNPQGRIYNKLLVLKTSFGQFKLAVLGVTSVGEIFLLSNTAWTNLDLPFHFSGHYCCKCAGSSRED